MLAKARGLRAENPKSSRSGSILGTPLEMGVDISRGRGWGGKDEVVIMVGHYVGKRKVGEGTEGQNGEIKPLGLNFEGAIGNGGGDQWGEVVQLRK